MTVNIYVVDDNNISFNEIYSFFSDIKEYRCYVKRVTTDNLEEELRMLPSLIILDEDSLNITLEETIEKINNNEDNKTTPQVVISTNPSKIHKNEVLKKGVLTYIRKPLEKDFFVNMIHNISNIIYLNRGVSPLTGLPGNTQIQTEIKRRLNNNEEFAIVYADLDNFKSYNDVYGFANGDEVIKFTSRVLAKNLNDCDEENRSFLGHIGGDDFVGIVNIQDQYEMAKNIVDEFDRDVRQYFTKEDLEKGYLEVPNRRGIIELFPIVSISIAIVEVRRDSNYSPLEIGEIGAQVKHQAKEMQGSSIVINRRKK